MSIDVCVCVYTQHQSHGRVVARGSIGFCGQQPWLISGTLKDNVLHGSPLDQARYEDAIRACGLAPDLEQFPDGDQVCNHFHFVSVFTLLTRTRCLSSLLGFRNT